MSFFQQSQFDATQVNPSGSREPIPQGRYRAMVSSCAEKPSRNGGLGLNIEMQVIEGPHKGRKLFYWINLRHTNAQVVEIGQEQLSAFCHATGILQPKSAGEFAGRVLEINVTLERRDTGELDNRVKSVVIPSAQAPAEQPQPQSQEGSAPWNS